jgi:hypothetical protein
MHPEVIKEASGSCPICGMDLIPMEPDETEEQKVYKDLLKKMKIATIFTIPVFFIAMIEMNEGNPLLKIMDASRWNWLQLLLTLPVVFYACWMFFLRAFKSIITWNLNMFTLNRYFQKDQNFEMALLIEFEFRTLLRYSDISRFTWENVLNKDELVLNEKKTGKKRSIKVGAVLKVLLLEYYDLMQQPDLQSTVFNYTLRHTNRLLQLGSRFVGMLKKRVSTHSLRKSGARFLYEENNRSEDVFLKISMILNHSSTQVSRRYLGITKEEISDVFSSFDIFL